MKRAHNKETMLILFIFALALISVPAQAAIVINYDAGTTYTTTALTGFSTTGAMMDGMRVTAFYTDGTVDQGIWANDDPLNPSSVSGSADGNNFTLSESGDTFGGTWSLVSNLGFDIERLIIEAGPGDTVFDIDWPTYPGTDGSASGWTFQYLGNANDYDLSVTYKNLVAVNGNPAVGDLYLDLGLFWTGRPYIGGSAAFQFIADTDNLLYSGDITPVSEPSTMLLFFYGLAGLAGFGWRFRK